MLRRSIEIFSELHVRADWRQAYRTEGRVERGAKKETRMVRWIVLACAACAASSCPAQDLEYPSARRVDQADTFHGERVTDPYRWMETESNERDDWVQAQDDLFRSYASGHARRDALERRIREIGTFASRGTPTIASSRSFYSHIPAGRSNSIWYVQDEGAEPRILIDTETYFDDPDKRLRGYTASPNGRYLAFAVDDGAGTWGEVRILDVDTGRELDDRLIGTSGPYGFPGVQWASDDSAFAYYHTDVRAPDGSDALAVRNVKVRWHRVGTPQNHDPILFARPDRPDMMVNTLALTTDDRYLITSITEKATRRTLHYAIDLQDTTVPAIELADESARLIHIGNNGSLQLYRTDLEAPNGRVIAIDVEQPERAHWREVIPEDEQALTSIAVSRDYIVARYDRDVKPELRVHRLDGTFLRRADVPGIGGIGLTTSPFNNEIHYSFGVLFDPGTTYRLDPETGQSTLVHRPTLAFDPGDYTISHVFYSSFDGTRVPMFIAHRKDLEIDGSAPLWMYAFGNGGWVAFPWFQSHLVAWMEMGGIYALPGIRGGGEYGAEWRDAGMLHNKPNTIGDFIAAAEWLIENNYTSADRLVANGGSGSGPLPAIAVNQRPELFGAAVVDFPFLDMLRYHISASGFTRSYGSPDNPDDYAVLRSYSPYHNIRRDACYPPVLVTVAEEDTSTAPHHGYKHIAALQHAQTCDAPVMLQVIWDVGHYSYGNDRKTTDANLANQVAFVARALGMSMDDE